SRRVSVHQQALSFHPATGRTRHRHFCDRIAERPSSGAGCHFVGEIRDYETALTALQASETGHLVLSTMHSEKVADTMERYLNLFPAEDAKHGTNLLANQLSGVLCQKLVESADGGLRLLVEHVENAGAMRDWMARRELQNIDQYISRGSDPAAVSFLQSTLKALQAKVISEATALASVSNESELRRAMRGIA